MAVEHRPYLARLRSKDFDEIVSDREAIEQLLGSRGWRLVSDLIEEVHGDAVIRLLFGHAGSDGKVLDQAEYSRLLGFLSGLRQTRWAAEAYVLHAERVRKQEEE